MSNMPNHEPTKSGESRSGKLPEGREHVVASSDDIARLKDRAKQLKDLLKTGGFRRTLRENVIQLYLIDEVVASVESGLVRMARTKPSKRLQANADDVAKLNELLDQTVDAIQYARDKINAFENFRLRLSCLAGNGSKFLEIALETGILPKPISRKRDDDDVSDDGD